MDTQQNSKSERVLYKPHKALSKSRSLEEAIGELERELGVRHRLYQSWIDGGRLPRTEACDNFERMWAALKFLDHLSDHFETRKEEIMWDNTQNALILVPKTGDTSGALFALPPEGNGV